MTRTGILAALSLLLTAQSAEAEDRLTPLLRFVPAEAVQNGAADAFVFADLAAIRQSVPMRLSLIDGFSWSAEDRMVAALMRSYALPAMLHVYAGNHAEIRRMREYVGFDWFDIETTAGFASPPIIPWIVTLDPDAMDADAIGATLSGRGFELEMHGGYPIWWRLEDYAYDLANRDLADPLRGHLGGSARAGVVDGAFLAASTWGVIDWMLAALDGTTASLAGSADFMALAHAFAEPVTADGLFLQAYLINGALGLDLLRDSAPRNASDEERAALAERIAASVGATGTPVYSAYGIADRQEGGALIGEVALVYSDRADAETAARTVPAAFAGQSSLVSDRSFSEIFPYEVVADVIAGPDGTRFVARIAFVAADEAPLEGPADNRNRPFEQLLEMLFSRDVGPLVTD